MGKISAASVEATALGERSARRQQSLCLSGTGPLGDVIQFARYVPLAEAKARRVVFEVPANLLRLFE